MDAAKKTAIEQRIVMGLAGIFVLTVCVGPLRSVGVFGRKAPAGGATPPTERVSVSQPLGVMMQRGWRRMDQEAETQDALRLAQAATDAPVYTAQHLRDPLESLLPTPGRQPSVPPTAQPATPSTARPTSPADASVPPPTLEVQGMVWGGAEPRAVIDDRVYGVDDMVEGGKILAIDRHGVTIEHKGRVREYAPASGRR